MQSIVTTMSDVNQNTQEIAGAVQQQSAGQMLQVSKDLSRHGEQLRDTVENFLRRVAVADALNNAS